MNTLSFDRRNTKEVADSQIHLNLHSDRPKKILHTYMYSNTKNAQLKKKKTQYIHFHLALTWEKGFHHISTHCYVCCRQAESHTCCANMDQSCLIYAWAIWTMHRRARHTCRLVLPHVWIGHVNHMDDSCHVYECIISRIFIGELMCKLTHSYMRQFAHK